MERQAMSRAEWLRRVADEFVEQGGMVRERAASLAALMVDGHYVDACDFTDPQQLVREEVASWNLQ